MVGRIHRQSSLFYVAFDRQAALIKDDLLEPIDQLLDDEELVALVQRNPSANDVGRNAAEFRRALRAGAREPSVVGANPETAPLELLAGAAGAGRIARSA